MHRNANRGNQLSRHARSNRGCAPRGRQASRSNGNVVGGASSAGGTQKGESSRNTLKSGSCNGHLKHALSGLGVRVQVPVIAYSRLHFDFPAKANLAAAGDHSEMVFENLTNIVEIWSVGAQQRVIFIQILVARYALPDPP